MYVYLTMFSLPALASFLFGPRGGGGRRSIAGFAAFFIAFVLLIGFRDATGGDWGSYVANVRAVTLQSAHTTLTDREFGYALVSWISVQLGWGIYGINTVCGLILMTGLVRFCRRQHDPWLAAAASVPYLVIVVGMGYVRQSAAIGFVLLALLDFQDGRRVRFVFFLALATLFHVSALAVLPVMAIVLARTRPILMVPMMIVSVPALYFVLVARADRFVNGYVAANYDSKGALIRLVMNAIPAVLFLLYRRRFPLRDDSRVLWTAFAWLAVALLVAFPAFPSSTVLDRIGLYLLPLQVLVFGNLTVAAASKPSDVRLLNLLTIAYYGAVLLVWLKLADNAEAWLPYRTILLP